ncbi:MAG: chromate transporter [Ruminococcus sp.]|nr:chromate transporter [Ruminococcus sp.]
MNLLTDLFLTFAKIGAFTFGGGYAMISFIEDICVKKKKWITHEEMMNITIIAESTPGPVAVNCSTFVGYKQAGIKGALSATLGMVLPSFVIIFIISLFLNNFLENEIVAKAFKGIKIAVGILILSVGINMIRKMKKNRLSLSIMSISCIAMLIINIFSVNFSSVVLMLMAGIASLIIFSVSGKIKEENK